MRPDRLKHEDMVREGQQYGNQHKDSLKGVGIEAVGQRESRSGSNEETVGSMGGMTIAIGIDIDARVAVNASQGRLNVHVCAVHMLLRSANLILVECQDKVQSETAAHGVERRVFGLKTGY